MLLEQWAVSNSPAGRKADRRRTYRPISVAGVIGTVTVRELGMGHQVNCLIIDIINFDLTIFKSQISVALGFTNNACFFIIWLGDTAGKLWKLNKPETHIRSHRKTMAPQVKHAFKTWVFDWCWKTAKECIGQTGLQSSRLRKVSSAFCPSRKDATNPYLPHPGKW